MKLEIIHNRSSINKYVVFIITIVLGTMISCTPAQKESKASEIQQQNKVTNTIVKSDTSGTVSSFPVTVPEIAKSNDSVVVNTATTPPELNPAHGKPFHRCDIPVGSPLNTAALAKPAAPLNRTGTSPSLENAASLNGQQTNIPTIPTVANKNSTPPQLNPPHGQPFHRCDIPVGSPLNAATLDKSAAPLNRTGTSPTVENAARLKSQRTNILTIPTVGNINSTPPQLNPPHGQPFHRCDIPVGSPLN